MKALLCWLSLAVTFAAAAVDAEMISLPPPVIAATNEPSLYTSTDGTVYLTYSGPGLQEDERALWLAILAPGAQTWTAPRAIVSTPLLMENWADFATVVEGTDGTLWAQWYQRHADPARLGYSGWAARSTDRGTTWNAAFPLGHEFVSLAPLSGGRVLAVWLESTRPPRAPSAPRRERQPGEPYSPSMQLRSRLLAPDGSTLGNWVVDPDVCNCCQTSVATLPNDEVLVAYRGHTPDEIRDNYIVRFDGKEWVSRRILHSDGWKITACPVNGPALDARGKTCAFAWFTAADGTARVQAKLSSDGGASVGPPLAIDLGRPLGRLDLVLLADGSALVSWLEARQEQTAAGLYVRRIFPDGSKSAPLRVTETTSARASGFARMAILPGERHAVVLAWTEVGPTPGGNQRPPTQVRSAIVRADGLVKSLSSHIVVTQGDRVVMLELCAPETPSHL